MPKPKARGYTPPSPPELMDHAAFRPRSATKSLPSAGLLLNQTHFGPSLPKSGQEQKTSMGIPGQTRPEWDLEQEATKAVWVMEGKRLFCWDQIKSFLCAKIKRWTLLVRWSDASGALIPSVCPLQEKSGHPDRFTSRPASYVSIAH